MSVACRGTSVVAVSLSFSWLDLAKLRPVSVDESTVSLLRHLIQSRNRTSSSSLTPILLPKFDTRFDDLTYRSKFKPCSICLLAFRENGFYLTRSPPCFIAFIVVELLDRYKDQFDRLHQRIAQISTVSILIRLLPAPSGSPPGSLRISGSPLDRNLRPLTPSFRPNSVSPKIEPTPLWDLG